MGQDAETGEFLKAFLPQVKESGHKCVLDADGLTWAARLGLLKPEALGENFVLTPHPGEAAKLLGVKIAKVQQDRFAAVKELASKSGASCVLKGPGSLVFCGALGSVCVEGNPGMATPGSGDVLSGVIAAFLARGLSCYGAACAGVYVHARAGDLARAKHGGPLIASDISEALPYAIGELWSS
jgi:NAD(P)H-hydrate epimerase